MHDSGDVIANGGTNGCGEKERVGEIVSQHPESAIIGFADRTSKGGGGGGNEPQCSVLHSFRSIFRMAEKSVLENRLMDVGFFR
jgi:hypothetical protein